LVATGLVFGVVFGKGSSRFFEGCKGDEKERDCSRRVARVCSGCSTNLEKDGEKLDRSK